MVNKKQQERLEFLKNRLEFRHKLFLEWLFVDKTLIHDYGDFLIRTREIEDEVAKLNDVNLGADE